MDLKKLLKNKSLLQDKCFIGGKWIAAKSRTTTEVINPSNNKTIGRVPSLSSSEVKGAIAEADKAFATWRNKTAKERADILRKWWELIIKNAEDLAIIMTAEMGKPLAEARSEIAYAASFVEWFAEEARRVRGDIIPPVTADKRIFALRQPVGVVVAITPWNFPAAMIARKVAPALAAGCTVVAKPPRRTPYSALALAKLAEQAGFPAGSINIVLGDPKTIGGELTGNPLVRKLSFTGSTAVGRILLAQCAATVKNVSMELGGNAPFIVFDDADLDRAVNGAMASKYRNTGQACTSTNRIFVQEKLYDAFVKKLTAKVKKLKVCDGFKKGAEQGPLIDMAPVEKIEKLIDDALARGAKIATGGKRHKLGGTFFQPTVITHLNDKMLFASEEIFGPISCVFKFKTEEEAVKRANNTEYGLAAYFYSGDTARQWRVAEALEYGMVGVNESLISTAVAPFGGVKESGIGREGSHLGINEFTEVKYVCLGNLA